MRESGEALVQTTRDPRGMKVLDLGCGDGTTAMPAAKLGADVLGVDIAQKPGRGREQARQGDGPQRTAGFRKAMRPICTSWRIKRLISS